MKSVIASLCSVLVTLVAYPAAAADNHAGHGTHAAPSAPAALADGVVKKVDKAGGKLTLAHGPLENLGMPAMTMAFAVKDKGLLGQLRDGDKVRFVAESVNGSLTIVKLEKAK